MGYLTYEQVSERLQVKEARTIKSGNFSIKYSVAMQRGYYRKYIYCFDNNDEYVCALCMFTSNSFNNFIILNGE